MKDHSSCKYNLKTCKNKDLGNLFKKGIGSYDPVVMAQCCSCLAVKVSVYFKVDNFAKF